MPAQITCTPSAISSYIPCINCASTPQLMAAIAVLLCKIVGQGARSPDCDPAVLLKEYACYQCNSETQTLQAIVKLLVNWILINIEGETNLNILHDISETANLQPHQIRAIIIGLLCDGTNGGTIFCSPLQ